MPLVRRARRMAALLAAITAAACGDSTAPTIDHIDTQAASAKVAPVMAVMEQPALESFGSLTNINGLPASASAAALGAVARLTNAAAHGRWDGSAPALARTAARAADVLPGDVRGKLYTYNETTQQYEGALNSDVPNTAAWIVLYAWDALTGRPATPLNPIGRVELIDESTTGQNKLHVIVRKNDGTVLLDYSITHTVSTSSESFSIGGTANNGTTEVTFNLTGLMTATSATVTFGLTTPPTVGFSVNVDVSLNAVNETATIHIRLGYDGHTLAFNMSAHANTVNGEIKFDGMRYASYSMTYDEATGTVTTQFVKANGQPMTAEEIQQIEDLFERALDFDQFWEGLLWPIGALASPV